MAEPQQDVDTLKRRGRRRLVGAVALVLLAVVVLPMIFDPEPRGTPPVNVRIPGEDDKPFAPKPPAQVVVAPKPAPAESPAQEKKAPEARPSPKKAEEKKAPSKAAATERARAEAALGDAQFVVQVGAFSNPDGVLAKLNAAKIRYYTEKVATSGGTVMRVRAGPYASKAEAERAVEMLRKLGLKPGGVVAKS